jgi:type II secretory pathway component HofQ
MRYALVMIAVLLCSGVPGLETIKITEKDKDEKVLRVETVGKDHGDETERPLKQFLDYLGSRDNVQFAVTDKSIQTILVSTNILKDNPKASWRAIVDSICKANKLRVDDSRLEKEHLIVISKPQLISVKFKDADIREVLWSIAQTGKVNIVIDPDVKGNVTVSLTDVPADEAIITVAKTLDYVAVKEKSGEFRVK